MTLVQTEPKSIKIGSTAIKRITIRPNIVRLPAEYQEVEYIETTGTQFIDTAVFPSNSIQVETDIEVTQTAQDKPVFGTYRIGTNNNDSISGYYHLTCYSNKWYYGLNGSEGNAGTYSPVAGTKYSIIYNNTANKLVIDNNEIATLTGTTGQSGCTLTISRRGWSSGSGNRYGQYKFYNFKMYDKSINEYVRDFVPCYRKADGVIGMYDLVNDQFYTNSGSGTFTKGNDVPLQVEKQIRPVGGWIPGTDTLLYLPLESDFVDRSGQATTRVFSTNGLSYTTVGGVPSVHIGTTGGAKLTTPYPLIGKDETKPVTVSVLVYVTSQQTSARRVIFDRGATGGNRIFFVLEGATTNIRYAIDYDNAGKEVSPKGTITANQWMHLVLVSTQGSIKGYKDGQLVGQITPGWTNPGGYRPNNYDNTQGIFCTRDVSLYSSALNGNARELIIEQKEWTADEVASYYTWIKNKLGF